MLYIFATVLVLYYSLIKIERFHWPGIIWILFIFLAINSSGQSFSREIRHRQWYLYSIAHPLAIYFSKLIFNFLALLMLNIMALALLNIFFDLPVFNSILLINTLVLSTLGISSIFTFVSLMAGKAYDQGGLIAILSIPLLFPILMAGSRLLMVAFSLLSDSSYVSDYASIIGIDIVSIGLSIILFPILWRD